MACLLVHTSSSGVCSLNPRIQMGVLIVFTYRKAAFSNPRLDSVYMGLLFLHTLVTEGLVVIKQAKLVPDEPTSPFALMVPCLQESQLAKTKTITLWSRLV